MKFYYLVLLVLYFPVHDLISAWLYGSWSLSGVYILRYARDLSVIFVTGLALVSVKQPLRMRSSIWLYIALTGIYALVGLLRDMPASIVLGSYGKLLIPFILFMVGYYCLSNTREFLLIGHFLLVIGCVSTLFGMFDIQSTEFWIDTIQLPEYLISVKGIETGLNPTNMLPWNFHGGIDSTRRAAGLLASPLAQGHFLAVVTIVALLLYSLRRRWIYLIALGLVLLGIWQSGTRGGMLIVCVAFTGLGLSSRIIFKAKIYRWTVFPFIAAGVYLVLEPIIFSTVHLLDGSSPGHWRALVTNIENLPGVIFFGSGVGFQGAFSARKLALRALLEGGGEGAVFSMAFQASVLCALVFLYFYWRCWRILSDTSFPDRTVVIINTTIKWLMVGFATTFFISETIFTFSGSAAFWIILGGSVRLCIISETQHSYNLTNATNPAPPLHPVLHGKQSPETNI